MKSTDRLIFSLQTRDPEMDRTIKIFRPMLDVSLGNFCMQYQENLKFGKNLLGTLARDFMDR